jgi:hypothetical protein
MRSSREIVRTMLGVELDCERGYVFLHLLLSRKHSECVFFWTSILGVGSSTADDGWDI